MASRTSGDVAPALVRSPSFLAFWTGQGVSQLGVQLGQLALPVLAVSLLGAGEMDLGVLNAAAMAAFLVVGLPAGAWVDRWLKRRTMVRADLVRMAAMAAVPVLWWAGALQMWHLYVVAAVVGVATVFFDVAYQSYIPLLVHRAQVAEANGKLEATAQVARMGGPALGGFLLTLVSAPVLFAAEAGGYLASALCLTRVHDTEEPPCPARAAAWQRRSARGPRSSPPTGSSGASSPARPPATCSPPSPMSSCLS
ncbi:Putative major facilitator superfamily transporter [Sinomonas atrocyanea]|uniref:Putative major facilitator superfamily transporter n=1 Tax=Sinomonas atrocyanea TaxID=37927 RepID=A0A127A2J2_9MICC|nr:MFS transporter [Sinomonas atrocyanea]AMM33407.1 Putative major facilitator superfamily transporter [Sinomonas atrocyanea]